MHSGNALSNPINTHGSDEDSEEEHGHGHAKESHVHGPRKVRSLVVKTDVSRARKKLVYCAVIDSPSKDALSLHNLSRFYDDL